MTAREATELSIANGFGEKMQEMIKRQDADIKRAASLGRRKAIFNVHETVDDYLEPEMKNYYLKNGFFFRQVGFIGGVWQKDIYICW